MIALKHPLPLVRGHDGDATALKPDWLRLAIRTAALKAGHAGLWQLDDLVTGISLYLGHCYRKPVIDLVILERMIRLALCETGFQEVADQVRELRPSQNISLVQLLRESVADGNVDEKFFVKLAEVIAKLDRAGVQHFSFNDLQACVESLPESSLPTDELPTTGFKQRIVDFVRHQVQSREWTDEIWCSIA